VKALENLRKQSRRLYGLVAVFLTFLANWLGGLNRLAGNVWFKVIEW